ncbi:hypothetical protein DB895_07435 [Flavobacterium psychrotolerans]|uniref:Uncharacterized protein n=1 Tax=Flavobacterium psychrotolerans TaxID=2169410 RepID=A0A2U1JJS6_9FLAO|nr:hypothetical protein DB895_07435 [Flavobacterium psychrotolerans]
MFSLIFLFLIDVFKFSTSFNDFLILLFEIDIDKIIQSLLYVLLYFSLINTFIVLFMILKRIEKLFSVKLNQEIEIIEKKEKKDLDNWEDIN